MAIAVLLLKITDYAGFLKMPIIQKDVAKALIPLISINVLGLGVNTLCLVYVDTSFYQVTSIEMNEWWTQGLKGLLVGTIVN